MDEKRINPETGVHEVYEGWVAGWQPEKNPDGRQQRVNPTTGVHEVHEGWVAGWQSEKSSDGRQQRVNPTTGVHEVYEGWVAGWQPAKNPNGCQEPLRRDIGFVGHIQRTRAIKVPGGVNDVLKGLGGLAFGLMCIGLTFGAIYVNEHATQFSFVWWLSFVVALVSGVFTIGILLAVGLAMLAVAAVLGVIWLVIWLISYFIQNPW